MYSTRHNFCSTPPNHKIQNKPVGKLYILAFLLFIFAQVRAQTIKVVNAKNGEPIEGVILVSETLSTQTDSQGYAKIDNFADEENILFQHASFLKLISQKTKIVNLGETIMLVEDPVRLDEIVVSVNRWQQWKSEIPHIIKTLKPEDVLHYNPQTSADLLAQKGGVFIQKSQMGGGSPMIRGFSANRVLIVVDGIRMNNAIYRSGNLQNVISVDANSLESTEIIFGPGSVIYGSDALGGVMSFNTLAPKLSTSDKTEQWGKIFSRFSSANFEKTVNAAYNVGSAKWAALFNATFSDFDNLRMGAYGPTEYLRPEYLLDRPYTEKDPFTAEDIVVKNGNQKIQKYTAYDQFNLMGKLRFRPNESLDFTFSAHHSQTGDIPRYDRLIEYGGNDLKYAQWFYGPQKWTLVSGRLEYKRDGVLFDKMNVLAGAQNYEESRHDRKVNSTTLRSRAENLGIYSLNIDFGKRFDSKNELFYGMEGYINHIGSNGTAQNMLNGEVQEIAPRYPDGSYYGSAAGYYSFKFNLNEKFIFQVGSRFTYTHLNGDFDPQHYNFPFTGFDLKNSAFNGNLGIVWHPTKEWQINLHGSTGFRSPNIDDVAKVFDSEPGHVVVPNPDLKPEYARNLELNIIRSYEQKAKVEITGFYTLLKNAMVRRNFTLNGQDSIVYDGEMSRVEALVNAESAVIYGATFSLEYLFSNRFRTRNEVTLTRGEDSEGIPLRHVPPTFGSSHFIYETPKWFVDFYANFNGGLQFEELAPDEQNKPHLYLPDERGNPYSPGWWTLNLKSNYKVNQDITLGGGVENILDRRYRSYSSGIVSPGINFILSLNARF